MNRRTLIRTALIFIAGAVIGGIIGVYTFIGLVGGSGEASATISAPTLSLDDQPMQPIPDIDSAQMATQIAQIGTDVAALSTVVAANDSSDLSTQIAGISTQVNTLGDAIESNESSGWIQAVSPTNTPPPTRTAVPTLTPTDTAQTNQRLFRIISEESEARYVVDELQPRINGLVGSTDQVAGDIIVDFANPSNSRIGVIRINMRTFQTNDPMRDSTVRGEILLSAQSEYEFSDFEPTAITGLTSTPVNVGDTIEFQVTGDFPVRGVTHSITFDVSVTIISEYEISGLASTTILRSDFGLLQSPLAMHGVAEDVLLQIEFVAREVSE